MEKYLLIIFLAITITSCENTNDSIGEEKETVKPFIWAPQVKAETGDQEVMLNLRDPRPFTEYVGGIPENPDYFEVMISTDSIQYAFHEKIENIQTTEVQISDLTNDQSYYFMVRSHKQDTGYVESNVVMTIPSADITQRK